MMRKILKQRLSGLKFGNGGFTLVELLVVVGIIVALGAVIVPNVLRFADSGNEGALEAERDAVQAAMDAMMADIGVTAVTANDLAATGDGVSDWTATPAEASLDTYLREDTTTFFYCWDATGLVTEQFDAAATACTQ
jgi:prepilin-type N-terminal cleavage/methylation domain-containing protein